MNRAQKKIILIESVIIGLIIWRYFDKSLTFNYVLFYTLLYTLCMFSWFYFTVDTLVQVTFRKIITRIFDMSCVLASFGHYHLLAS